MKQNKEQKWYPTKYNSTWCIEDIESRDVLDIEQVGKEQAEYNAKLCASAPELLKIAHELYIALENSKPMTNIVTEDKYKSMEMFEKIYKKLCKKEQ